MGSIKMQGRRKKMEEKALMEEGGASLLQRIVHICVLYKII